MYFGRKLHYTNERTESEKKTKPPYEKEPPTTKIKHLPSIRNYSLTPREAAQDSRFPKKLYTSISNVPHGGMEEAKTYPNTTNKSK